MDRLERSYGEHPYPLVAHYQTRPARLQGIAALHGIDAPPPDRCRILELGCGTGGNLLPMAEALPGARLLGLDFSAPQIERARRAAADAGLANLAFRRADLAEPLEDLGEFDYILAHGLFSWVPAGLQDRILQLCRDHLAPTGVAYLSFNCLPGWHLNLWLRDLLRFAYEPTGELPRARDFAALVAGSPALEPELKALLQRKLAALPAREDAYLVHEWLEDENHPLTFLAFAERAQEHGLQYLADAESNLVLQDDGSPISAQLRPITAGFERREQCLDYLRHRQFRRALLCRQELQVDRDRLEARLSGLALLSRLREIPGQAGQARFQGHGAVEGISVGDARLAAVLRLLQERYPAAAPCAELRPLLGGGSLASLLALWRMGALEVLASPDPAPAPLGARPALTAVARLLGREGTLLQSRNLTPVEVPASHQKLLTLVDGSRTLSELARDGAALLPPAAATEAELVRFLDWCRRQALLAE